jgi:5'-nucleotidase
LIINEWEITFSLKTKKRMIEKKILYIDMDGVIVDLQSGINQWGLDNPTLYKKYYKDSPDTIPNLFKDPKPIDKSIVSVLKLIESGKYEIFIATASPNDNDTAASEKILWIKKYFGDLFDRKIFILHRKDLLIGDYLIDDMKRNGDADFKVELLSFGYNYETNEVNEYPDWDSILEKLL